MQRLRFTLLLIGATVLSLALGNSLLHAQGGADYILREVARLHTLPPALADWLVSCGKCEGCDGVLLSR